ncbi:terminase [Bordetella flabilis]|uniref:Terminase n=1 Tax=Bordetella flabilis TaxID=463014 RepID=A0A193GMQ6_9BORD|nr:terminase [Bordetella flabilis]
MHVWDTDYGLPVLRGEILVGRLTYLAVARHYQDLLDGPARGLEFSPGHARHVIDFIEQHFIHIRGPLARKPVLLDPWQKFWTAVLYGWIKADTGLRRFNTAYEEVARKNGKSTWKAPQAVYLFMMDGEVGAEVYTIATTRDQAMAIFKPALDNVKRWARQSPGIAKSFKIHDGKNQEQITFDSSELRPLPANADALDGKNPHATFVDELHAHKTPEVWEVMESARGSRSQPLQSAITTAGFILDGVCMDVRSYLVSLLEGRRQDDSFFGYIYTLDEGDDPLAERNWPKANPGLGLSKTWEYMRSMARKAAALPSAMANFKTKDLNIWCNDAEGWIDLDVWDKGGKRFDPLELRGRRCFGGMDLSATRDLTALSLVFPPNDEDPHWYLLAWVYCPRAKVTEQSKDDATPYEKWERSGHLTVTEGDITDYVPMRDQILAIRNLYDLVEMAYDKWNATHLVNELDEEGVPLVEVPQNTAGMYPGSKRLEELVYGKRLRHGGNPVLRSAAANVSLLYDTNGNFRPDKKKSSPRGRIDPIVATVLALSRAAVYVHEDLDGFVNDPVMVGV